MKKKTKAARRVPKVLPATLYCYVESANAKHAKTTGKKLFGSFSSYVNALIAKDRGATPALGAWKSEGESAKLKKEKRSEPKKAAPGKKELSLVEKVGLVSPPLDVKNLPPVHEVRGQFDDPANPWLEIVKPNSSSIQNVATSQKDELKVSNEESNQVATDYSDYEGIE